MSECARCNGERWVCESHHGRPWGDMCCDGPRRAAVLHWLHRFLPYRGPLRLAWSIRVLCAHGACHCGGAGDPCPSCNPQGETDPGWTRIIAEAGQ